MCKKGKQIVNIWCNLPIKHEILTSHCWHNNVLDCHWIFTRPLPESMSCYIRNSLTNLTIQSMIAYINFACDNYQRYWHWYIYISFILFQFIYEINFPRMHIFYPVLSINFLIVLFLSRRVEFARSWLCLKMLNVFENIWRFWKCTDLISIFDSVIYTRISYWIFKKKKKKNDASWENLISSKISERCKIKIISRYISI